MEDMTPLVVNPTNVDSEFPSPHIEEPVAPVTHVPQPDPQPTTPTNVGDLSPEAKKVQDKWDEVSPDDGTSLTVRVPKANESVQFERIETEKNVVRVWTNGNKSDEPDFIIVNPPTHVEVSEYAPETIEDPLSAIAEAIHGAKV